MLTPRQDEIMRLLTQGLTTRQIAGQLEISPKTVATHLHLAFRELRCRNRTAAAVKYLKLRWSSGEDDVSGLDGADLT